jgi:hypothetical protein
MVTNKLYSNKDIEIIQNNIGDVLDDVKKIKAKKFEPTIDEFKSVLKVILDYIKEHKRVIYGGYARNEVIKQKDPSKAIYDEYDKGDIDFYSYEPVVDLINIADILHQRGFKYIQAKPAQHEETYSIFVNFENVCDISYMPKYILDNLPKVTIKGIHYTHPRFMFIDMLRVFNDPMTSYFVLEKTFKRTVQMIEIFPFQKLNCELPKLHKTNNSEQIRKMILLNSDTLIVAGHYAYYYYKYKAEDKKIDLEVPFYDVYSTDIEKDSNIIYEKLRKIYNDVKVEEYRPYFQFLDQRIEFYHKDKLILRLIGNYGKCIPYIFLEKKGIKIATFSYLLMFTLIMAIYFDMKKNNIIKDLYNCMFSHLLEFRQIYLNKTNKTIMDDTPFKEFVLRCSGETMEPRRAWLLDKTEKRKQKTRSYGEFIYNPANPPQNFDPKRIKFYNTSGNIITDKNKYDKILLLDEEGNIININYDTETSSIGSDFAETESQFGGYNDNVIIDDDFENEIIKDIFVANENEVTGGFESTS